jgi:2-polyprenyl-3-methyl-5-hydroxy-6-metoxy-1,4-benzoquinol methylase
VIRGSGHPEKALFYERLAPRFDAVMDRYDLERRLEIVFDELLAGDDLRGLLFLDAGCGTGHFSRKAEESGARVVALDVGPNLLGEVRRKCGARVVVGDLLALGFADGVFPRVLATEVIEHTRDPQAAVAELWRVLAPGGTLALTVPNSAWQFAVRAADALHLRPYEGYENWVGWRQIGHWIEDLGGRVAIRKGFHLFPFTFRATHGLLRRLDRHGRRLGPAMVNIAVRAIKP